VTREELLKFYEGKIAKWWMPDDVVFVDAIPLGATGKMLKNLPLRRRHDMKMEALTTFMKDQPDIKKVYLINQNYSHGQQVAKYAKEYLKRKRPDIQIVGEDLHPLGAGEGLRALRRQDQGSPAPTP
jgi:hypothetical protein